MIGVRVPRPLTAVVGVLGTVGLLGPVAAMWAVVLA